MTLNELYGWLNTMHEWNEDIRHEMAQAQER